MEQYRYVKKTVYEKAGQKVVEEAYRYAEEYKQFLNLAKTEREATLVGEEMLKKAGYLPYSFGQKLKAGDKFYYINRNKNIFAFQIGTKPIEQGIRITAAHIDSPRLDLKQLPLFEKEGVAYFKTHYYGGIRKYQWLTIPLALHGVIIKENGETITLSLGEKESDPIFYISDLLPHLAHNNNKPINEAIDPEKMNVMLGNTPLADEEKDKVSAYLLQYLHKEYGIVEEDLQSAELCMVPADKARDIGFDRSMIGGYGHDDRCCAYPALTSLIDTDKPEYTSMCILVDKEEIGSEGVSGMQSDLITDLIDEIAKALSGNPIVVRANSRCFSSDVTANYDPDYDEVFEKKNSAIIGCGVGVCKFTGSRGKSGTSDASAEMVAWTRRCLNQNGICWQLTELGKVDVGGGGTVAKYMAKHNIDTIDIGVGVTSMHAPYELIAKVDLYEAYRAFKAFYKF